MKGYIPPVLAFLSSGSSSGQSLIMRGRSHLPSYIAGDISQNQKAGSYLGSNFTGLSMIKDKVIKPLVIATEKVVEYYFPQEKQESLQSASLSKISKLQTSSQKVLGNRLSAGSTNKTTVDDATFLSDQDSSELSKIKRRLKRLDISSLDESSQNKYESPKSHRTLKKRRFRQLERQDFFSPNSSINSQ